ncbi:hypothetical protein [Chryseobacterium sp. Hurlbut01]|uniref:hypothetical protein n=1 Tax=Chryseobacterium sp. Hurlbut01 TaxID=1681828 RepID=UPI00067D1515|nr:hypothetical protein [Chryseobacterium sp. Hurlbut01]
MKNKNVLKILKNKDALKNQRLYTELLKEYAAETTVRTVYYYQLGYTPEKLTGLIYDVKKHFGITDKDIALYNGEEEEEEIQIQSFIDTSTNTLISLVNPNAEVLKILNLESVPDVMDGMKFRDEYPFLNDENTPNEFKILATDKITAYKQYALKHAEILKASDEGEAEEKLFEIGKEALNKWNLNQEIKEELDFYRDSNGKILGKHPLLADLKMKQDVAEMSEADLVKSRTNAQKSVSKYKNEGKADLEEKHQKKLDAIEERLVKVFNYELKK